MQATHGKRIAVIENEFGEVGIDDALLAKNTKMQVKEELIEMMNGCICCTVRRDPLFVLQKLAKRIQSGKLKLDAIVIETTGMADPAPVAQSFFVDDMVKSFARLDGIVTLVDAKHIDQHLDEEKPEGPENKAAEQVAFADRLLLNKTDLVTEADLERVEARLRSINKFAPIARCSHSEVSVDSVLGIRGFDLKRMLEMDPEFLNTENEYEHDASVSSLSITQPGDVDLELVQEWIGTLLCEKGKDLFRMKGVLAIAHAKHKFVYQAVHTIFDGSFDEDASWSEGEGHLSKLVFIGRSLDQVELKSGFAACAATPEVYERRAKALRFAIGAKVECNTGDGWVEGRVVATMYRDKSMPPGRIAPYRVKLVDEEVEIYAPMDTDDVIRRPGGEGGGKWSASSTGASSKGPTKKKKTAHV